MGPQLTGLVHAAGEKDNFGSWNFNYVVYDSYFIWQDLSPPPPFYKTDPINNVCFQVARMYLRKVQGEACDDVSDGQDTDSRGGY